ncbi:Wall-associated kinase family protein [Perilla frutescens var. frutescens]|nr:Wall-associated kinase family protein [Perilla frutescens var. frutescens]
MKELEKATDQFNKSRILGLGGKGIVYKGMLSDGVIVAIKKLKQVDDGHLEQFINEIVILSQVDHRNVIKLLGCCLEQEVPLLVYEFVPNGTLSNLIHDPDNTFPVSWNMRLKIGADIARALAYLHYSTSIPIYHRDIKSSNILIGEKFIVKVSDFGISKSVEAEKTHITTLVKGTGGYLDPEYYKSGQFTDKSDVYSFGVILVELLTGQRPEKRTQDEKILAMQFLASMEERTLDCILDPLVKEQGQKAEVMAVARLAQRCLNSMGKMRTTMNDVATELANYRNIAQMSSTLEDESEEAKAYLAKPMMISDTQYTWTTSEISSSSDTHPFRSETVCFCS